VAVKEGHMDIVECLVKSNADINLQDNKGVGEHMSTNCLCCLISPKIMDSNIPTQQTQQWT